MSIRSCISVLLIYSLKFAAVCAAQEAKVVDLDDFIGMPRSQATQEVEHLFGKRTLIKAEIIIWSSRYPGTPLSTHDRLSGFLAACSRTAAQREFSSKVDKIDPADRTGREHIDANSKGLFGWRIRFDFAKHKGMEFVSSGSELEHAGRKPISKASFKDLDGKCLIFDVSLNESVPFANVSVMASSLVHEIYDVNGVLASGE